MTIFISSLDWYRCDEYKNAFFDCQILLSENSIIFWFDHFQLEFEAETLQFCSTHGDSKSPKYEVQTPSQSWWTRIPFFGPSCSQKKHSYMNCSPKKTCSAWFQIFKTSPRLTKCSKLWSECRNGEDPFSRRDYNLDFLKPGHGTRSYGRPKLKTSRFPTIPLYKL